MKTLRELFTGPPPAPPVPDPVPGLQEELARAEAQAMIFEERFLALELQYENLGWLKLAADVNAQFTREGLRDIIDYARVMFLKNPLIGRAVEVQTIYVWGQGWNVKADDDQVNDVIQAFLDDRKNREELTSQQARESKEDELHNTGNLFFVFFVNSSTGRTRMRSFPVEEITEIIKNPDDRRQSWYYHRKWKQRNFDLEHGTVRDEPKEAYYPDWQYRPKGGHPAKIGNIPVMEVNPVYHRKAGGTDTMDFGMPQTYRGLDWATAAKDYMTDWAAVMRAMARFAMALRTRGRPAVDAAKAKLGTTIASGVTDPRIETNPPPLAGSTWISTDGADLAPIRTAGATGSPEQSRRLWLMVCAAVGLPETFFGDSDVGNYATSKTLDRPTELKMKRRQTLWADIFGDILSFVIEQAVIAENGPLHDGAEITDTEEDGLLETTITLAPDEKTGQPASQHVEITFPDILERDVTDRISAIVDAATLGGHPNANIIPQRYLVELLLKALSFDDVDEVLDLLFPVDQDGNPLPPGIDDPSLQDPEIDGTPPIGVGVIDPTVLEGRRFVAALNTFIENLRRDGVATEGGAHGA